MSLKTPRCKLTEPLAGNRRYSVAFSYLVSASKREVAHALSG